MARILLIDDDDAVRATLRDILQNGGYQVTEAADGVQGVASYRQTPPDLVISDIIMPEQEGIETILEIRSIAPNARIVGISGGGRTGNQDFLKIAKQVGANDVIAKPIRGDELLRCVAALLTGKVKGPPTPAGKRPKK